MEALRPLPARLTAMTQMLPQAKSCLISAAPTAPTVPQPERRSLTKIRAFVFQRLHRLLAKMPPKCRLEVLRSRFSEPQRLDLEAWILRQRRTPEGREAPRFRGPAVRSEFRGAEASGEQRRCKRQRPPPNLAPAPLRSRSGQQSLPGLTCHVRGRDRYYAAIESVEHVQIISKTTPSLSVALGFRDVLLTMKQRVLSTSKLRGFECGFREAVLGTLKDRGVSAEAIGLRFVICLRSPGISAKLRSVPYRMVNFEAFLRAWERLTAAKAGSIGRRQQCGNAESEWKRLREAYVETMSEAGVWSASVAARVDKLEASVLQQRQLQIQHWNQAAMLKEEKAQRRRQFVFAAGDATGGKRKARPSPRQLRTPKVPLRSDAAVEKLLRRWSWAEAHRNQRIPGDSPSILSRRSD